MSSTAFFTVYKQLKLPKATLTVKYDLAGNTLTLSTDKLIKNLFIDHKQHYIHLSDNYMDLLPGHDVTVALLRGLSLKDVKEGLKYTSLREASVNESLSVKIV